MTLSLLEYASGRPVAVDPSDVTLASIAALPPLETTPGLAGTLFVVTSSGATVRVQGSVDVVRAQILSAPTSGKYTPVLTPGTNCTGAVLKSARWLKIGGVVVLFCEVDATAAAGGPMDFNFSLPVATLFAAATDGNGNATGDPLTGGNVQAVAGGALGLCAVTAGGAGVVNIHFNFCYSVLP